MWNCTPLWCIRCIGFPQCCNTRTRVKSWRSLGKTKTVTHRRESYYFAPSSSATRIDKSLVLFKQLFHLCFLLIRVCSWPYRANTKWLKDGYGTFDSITRQNLSVLIPSHETSERTCLNLLCIVCLLWSRKFKLRYYLCLIRFHIANLWLNWVKLELFRFCHLHLIYNNSFDDAFEWQLWYFILW